ncbi:MAG: formyl transferase [Deltaproteobacteria bacterium]|nr:formyl transferase [Deltaproteobacteria bacterium]
MPQTPIFDAKTQKRPMRVAGFMSGSGTNITKLVGLQHRLRAETDECPFEVVFIFSDRSDGGSQGEKIALAAGVPYFSYDIRRFHTIRGLRRSVAASEGLEARQAYDETAKKLVEAFEVDVVALGGYMSYITLPRCVNVHPADLTIKSAHGSRRFVGDDAVRDAILAGETALRASTLWTDEGVDTGPVLLVSRPVKVRLPLDLERLRKDEALLDKVVTENQERLKEVGDWEIFPKTILWIAQGRFGLDENGAVYLDGAPLADGYRLEEE